MIFLFYLRFIFFFFPEKKGLVVLSFLLYLFQFFFFLVLFILVATEMLNFFVWRIFFCGRVAEIHE